MRNTPFLVVLAGVVACSQPADDGDGSGDSPEPLMVTEAPLAQADLPRVFARAACGAYERCSCSWEDLVSCRQDGICYANEAECIDAFEATAEIQFRGAADLYDADVARQCINAMLTSPCEDASWFEVCAGIFGPVPELPQRMVAALGEACSGTCKGAPGEGYCAVELGGNSTRQCSFDDGATCLDFVCAPLGSEGAACDGELECEPSLACIYDTCATRVEPGQACFLDLENPCTLGHYCDGSVCVPQLELGSTCDDDDECVTGECAGACVMPGQEPVCQL